MQQLENVTIESFKNTAMLQHALAQQGISQLQEAIAKDEINQANIAIQQVQAAINVNRAKIDNIDSFFGELSDYIDGLIKIWKGVPADTQSTLVNSAATEAGIQGHATGSSLGIGASATVTAGFVASFVVSYITMSGMADENPLTFRDLNTT